MAKKKFGERALNSGTYVDETITKALEENIPTAKKVEPVAALETSNNQEPEENRVGERKPKKTSRKSSAKVAEPEVEKTIGLNLPMPKSLYKRISNMKLDMDGESLKSLGIKAIEEFLKKKGY